MASRILAPRLRTRTPARPYSAGSTPSRHRQVYSDFVPAMIPIFLLGSAIFLGAKLLQSTLAHEKWLAEAQERVRALEAEVDALRAARPGPAATATVDRGNDSGGSARGRWW